MEFQQQGKVSKTVPFDKLTDCDIEEPAGSSGCFLMLVPNTLNIVQVPPLVSKQTTSLSQQPRRSTTTWPGRASVASPKAQAGHPSQYFPGGHGERLALRGRARALSEGHDWRRRIQEGRMGDEARRAHPGHRGRRGAGHYQHAARRELSRGRRNGRLQRREARRADGAAGGYPCGAQGAKPYPAQTGTNTVVVGRTVLAPPGMAARARRRKVLRPDRPPKANARSPSDQMACFSCRVRMWPLGARTVVLLTLLQIYAWLSAGLVW